jgi:hypothetical protein
MAADHLTGHLRKRSTVAMSSFGRSKAAYGEMVALSGQGSASHASQYARGGCNGCTQRDPWRDGCAHCLAAIKQQAPDPQNVLLKGNGNPSGEASRRLNEWRD